VSSIKEAPHKPIKMYEVSEAVSEAAKVQAHQSVFARTLRFNIEGIIDHEEDGEVANDKSLDINYL
jgi:hypothetical protein